jgi:hypothetical protein
MQRLPADDASLRHTQDRNRRNVAGHGTSAWGTRPADLKVSARPSVHRSSRATKTGEVDVCRFAVGRSALGGFPGYLEKQAIPEQCSSWNPTRRRRRRYAPASGGIRRLTHELPDRGLDGCGSVVVHTMASQATDRIAASGSERAGAGWQ